MMQPLLDPFSLVLNLRSGHLEPATGTIERRLSQMRGMYADAEAERALIEAGDPLLYEVAQYDVPTTNGQLLVSTTVLYPGRVGDEYFMTKGHYHQKRDAAEIYLGLQGRGMVLLLAEDCLRELPMTQGTISYIPPYWAHRTVNTGEEPLVFFAVCPADAGHDYGTIEREGFPGRVLAQDDGPVVVRSSSAQP